MLSLREWGASMLLFNSKTRKKETFVPLREGKVGLYACGTTVYDYFHVGNARMLIFFDLLRRYLEFRGMEVTFVQNFTDIDDKMIDRANAEGITVKELGDRFIDEYFRDASALGIRPATVHPRATEHIPQIIQLIERLFARSLAYESGGNVYFDTAAFPGYGKLSGQNMDELAAGARVESGEEKQSPADFVLWKAWKPGEPFWDSPWGKGRPGWHVECSAMSMTYLGETFDIHGGGKDLLFPHHENEVAQSEGATGKPFVRYWMHNGFIHIDEEKMSKSAGNFFTVRDILKTYDPEAIRLFMLSAHYRSPLNFSREAVTQASASLSRLYGARDRLEALLLHNGPGILSPQEIAFMDRVSIVRTRFTDAMDDDLNTAEAVGVLFDLVRDCFVTLDEQSAPPAVSAALDTLLSLASVLGLLSQSPAELPEEILSLASQREEARKNKDWILSDSLRARLIQAGYVVEDTPRGQKVRKKT